MNKYQVDVYDEESGEMDTVVVTAPTVSQAQVQAINSFPDMDNIIIEDVILIENDSYALSNTRPPWAPIMHSTTDNRPPWAPASTASTRTTELEPVSRPLWAPR